MVYEFMGIEVHEVVMPPCADVIHSDATVLDEFNAGHGAIESSPPDLVVAVEIFGLDLSGFG
jgi:hypothetical protein